MKKLMIIAAAALCATAFADIESSNVVGYQQKETVEGFNFVIPSFEAVGGGKVNIQDIKIDGATDWADNIQVLDEGGSTIAIYYYASKDESGLDVDGWLSETGDSLATVSFEGGQSVLIETSQAATITFAGQVPTVDTVVNTVEGFNFTGNNTPATINIQDILIEGAMDWADNIQVLDEGGSTIAIYYYATKGETGLDADGWLSETGDSLADIEILPGQGLLIETAGSAKVTIPGVDL